MSPGGGAAEICPSFVAALLFQALKEPHKPAIATGAGVITYAQLVDAIVAATMRCERAGLRPGTIVALHIADPIWHVCLIAALYRLGVVSMSVASNDAPTLAALGVGSVLHDGAIPAGYTGPALQVEPDWFRAEGASGLANEVRFADDELCRITLSSGTTGRPKPIALSTRIIWHRLTTYSLRGRFAASERIYCGPQLRSQFAFAIAFAALAYGKMVCFAESASASLTLMSFYKIDLAIVSVFQLGALAEMLQKRHGELVDLREIQAGGALISNALLERARSALSCGIVSAYASTEAGTVALAPVEQLGALRNDGAVGFVTPWSAVDICDDDGRVLPPGREGSLRVRSLGLAPEFKPGMRIVEAEQPFMPGDYGRVIGNGLLLVAGRTTEVVNLGGNKVAPDRLEEVIVQCRGVKDAAVVVVEFNATIPQVWAAVVADGPVDQAEIVRRCTEIAPIAAPSVVKIVAAIPRGPEGKILRAQLRQELLTAGRSKE